MKYTVKELLTFNPEIIAEKKKTVEPMQLFDDLFYVGTGMIGIFILKTEDGLVLIDSTDDVDAWDKWLEPGLKKLGLDQEPVRMLLLTHGHFDHYLGAKKIAEKTGCDVALSETDTAYMLWCDENRDKPHVYPSITKLLKDEEDLAFGKHTIHVLYAPGHTPGCLNFAFPVHDNGTEHRAIMVGGFGIFGRGFYPEHVYPYSVEWSLEQACAFAASTAKTWEYCKSHSCDVYFNPHAHLCGLMEYGADNRERKPGEENALVIGTEGVREWLNERFEASLKMIQTFTDIQTAYK